MVTGNGIVAWAKNAGAVLVALSGAVYAFGYLVLRARARALGTDPGFALIDQVYVFAGFRFVLALLFVLLVMTPVLVSLRSIGRLLSWLLSSGPLSVLETFAALYIGAATIWAYDMTIGVSNVLFAPSFGWLADAVLERNNYGALMVMATTAMGAATGMWIHAHFERLGSLDPLGAVLLLIGVLLFVLLPIQYGVFYSERSVRQLERAPDGVTGLASPIWLVDRGASDRVVLYGRATDGQARLVILKGEKLDGIAVTGVSSLGRAVGERNR